MLAMIEAQATANADLIIGRSPYPQRWVWADRRRRWESIRCHFPRQFAHFDAHDGTPLPTRFHLPLCSSDRRAHAYGEGLTRYRARDFAAAAEQFARVAAEDPPSALLLARVRQLARDPPGPQWEPVTAQEEK